MKKILLLMLCVALVLAGCAGQSAPASSAPQSAAPAPASSADSAPSSEAPAAPQTPDYPTKPVETMVQWAAGGGGDLVFRALAEVFSTHANGQPMVIKNVDGASGVVGTSEFLTATPDGYNIMHWNNAQVIRAHMTKVPYDHESFEPVIQVVESAAYLIVQAESPWNTLEEFLEDAKAAPGSISLGNAGVGGGNHLAALIFEQKVDAEFNHVAYGGGGPAVTGLLSGEIDAVMANAPEGMSNVDAGQLKILVSLGSKRFDNYPDVPTAEESGIDLVYEQWRGVVVPKGTPPEMIEALHDIFKNCIEDERYVKAIESLGATPRYRNTEDFRKFLDDENQLFLDLIKTQKLGDIYG